MLVLYLCLLLTMWKSVTRNLNFINSRLQYIEWQQRLRNGMHQISETSNLSSSSNSTPDSHLDEFFAALSSKVATFERIRQLITFYFVGEIIIVRLILIFWLNVADIATITQLSIELITVSWLCVALHERSRLSAATQLLQQVRFSFSSGSIFLCFSRMEPLLLFSPYSSQWINLQTPLSSNRLLPCSVREGPPAPRLSLWFIQMETGSWAWNCRDKLNRI